MFDSRLNVSCLCGKASQQVTIRGGQDQQQVKASWQASQKLCHCHACRHGTGILCTSFLPIARPLQSSVESLAVYATSPHSTSYFCPTCGCHVFVASSDSAASAPGDEGAEQWAVATGTITGSPEPEDPNPALAPSELIPAWEWVHDHVSDTKDGGLSVWIKNASASSPGTEPPTHEAEAPSIAPKQSLQQEILPASCHCGTVRLHITRPDASSWLPSSPFSDLVVPFCRTDPAIVKNPSDVKWWLRGENNSKYFAGTCACRSCRLISGFEIQTWAFIPRSNISIYSLPSPSTGEGREPRQLDFDSIPPPVLRSYESSPGVIREFCPRCGATVFWHDRVRPDLVDVSVGLLEASEGARAESWLEWCTSRISFVEETGAQMPRQQIAYWRAQNLIEALERGLSLQNKG